MTDDVRADARRLLQDITPGPWVAEYSREQGNCVIPADARSTREAVAITRLFHQHADAEFIAAAPGLVGRLLVELDRVTADLEAAAYRHGQLQARIGKRDRTLARIQAVATDVDQWGGHSGPAFARHILNIIGGEK